MIEELSPAAPRRARRPAGLGTPTRHCALWHDRAVFHFLTDPADRDRHRQVLDAALEEGGHVAIGTFAADGPGQCSGLPTAGYDPDALAGQFGNALVLACVARTSGAHTPIEVKLDGRSSSPERIHRNGACSASAQVGAMRAGHLAMKLSPSTCRR